MKYLVPFLVLVMFLLAPPAQVQAQWHELYATWDDYNSSPDTNSTGTNTNAVGVIGDNVFIALCAPVGSGTTSDNYMLPYVNADSSHGRLYSFGYDPSGIFDVWTDGAFDQVSLENALYLKATPDSLIYVANNDPLHNILVFKFAHDTVSVVDINGVWPRLETGSHRIYALDIDQSGYVYVANDSSTGVTDDIKIYPPVTQWTASHTDAPVATVDLPDGVYKGLTVTPDGHAIFVSDYAGRKILKYVGSRTGGYSPDPAFTCVMGAADTIPASAFLPTYIGLQYLPSNNILFAVSDTWAWTSSYRTYNYGRIYLLNPNTGAMISPDSSVSVIDQAKWNFEMMDSSYTNRVDGRVPGNASGYTSTLDVKFDANGNVYSQSYNGWTVEKWAYNGTLPVITGVREVGATTPAEYSLRQNYPNPFNPATTIEFSLKQSGHVKLTVTNIIGQEVATLVNEARNAGTHRVTFDARSLPSGTYFYSITVNGYNEVRKMLLVK